MRELIEDFLHSLREEKGYSNNTVVAYRIHASDRHGTIHTKWRSYRGEGIDVQRQLVEHATDDLVKR